MSRGRVQSSKTSMPLLLIVGQLHCPLTIAFRLRESPAELDPADRRRLSECPAGQFFDQWSCDTWCDEGCDCDYGGQRNCQSCDSSCDNDCDEAACVDFSPPAPPECVCMVNKRCEYDEAKCQGIQMVFFAVVAVLALLSCCGCVFRRRRLLLELYRKRAERPAAATQELAPMRMAAAPTPAPAPGPAL